MISFVLASASVVWYIILWSIGLIGCLAARKRYRLRPRSPLASAAANTVPGVTILRPLKGLDHNLYENLESTFMQEYPNFEVFFCVEDERDQALTIVRDLMAKYPSVNARIAIRDGEPVGVNPKINNLITAYRQASHDILWVLDSNVMADRGTLARAVDILEPPSTATPLRRRIGVVHHVPFAWVTKPSLGSCIEEAFLNTNHAKMYIAINTVAVDSCVVGKSCLYRKSDMERVNGSLRPIANAEQGGFQPGERGLKMFGRFLAEDNMIAGSLWHELGLRHDISCDVAKNAVGDMSPIDYITRRIRWIRVRKRMVLAATLAEPFTESMFVGVLTSLGLRYLLGLSPWFFLPVHFLAWVLVDMDVYTSMAGHPVPADKRWMFVVSWALRELLALPVWTMAMLGSEVEWRGKRYRVMKNGEVERVASMASGLLGWFRKRKDFYEPLDISD
ncbi:glycosyltransferase family 21 protein [Epithele typhae]|uniref:glycosyltransferase family 21 protein n=1 Tax=Epithele typhae TaxID=378194 RepID=UPI00200749CF|nr:glycosyltransferase family 21 protein [Epithele typhae]KAH9944207.1 glycosyltransferase family 21 protein [Epithele typhae]